MPTNLPPEYFKAEERYRTAKTTKEKIASLEELIRSVPKHKGTERLRGDLKRKLSKLKDAGHKKRGAERSVSPFVIDREGAAQVAVIGPPNSGKSSLVAATTRAAPEVADFPFTTWMPTPGMLRYEKVGIQLIDTPPLHREHLDPEMLNLIRRADLALLVVDLQAGPLNQLEDMQALLEQQNILPRALQTRFTGRQGLHSLPMLVAANKMDGSAQEEDLDIFRELAGLDWPILGLSVLTGRNLDDLGRELFTRLALVRIYSKAPGKAPDYSEPFVLRAGSTVEDFAARLHRDFAQRLKSARVWGSGLFDGQQVGRDHQLNDGDVVELRL